MGWWMEDRYTKRHAVTDKHNFTGTFFQIYEAGGEKYIKIHFRMVLQPITGYSYLVPVLYQYTHHNWFKLDEILEWNISYGLDKAGFDFQKTIHNTIMEYDEAFKFVNDRVQDVADGCYNVNLVLIESDSPCGYYYA